MPTTPPAPARLSTTTCCPQFSLIFEAILRAMRSLALPGVNGTMMRIGLDGYFCAYKTSAAVATTNPMSNANVTLCMRILLRLDVQTFYLLFDLNIITRHCCGQ